MPELPRWDKATSLYKSAWCSFHSNKKTRDGPHSNRIKWQDKKYTIESTHKDFKCHLLTCASIWPQILFLYKSLNLFKKTIFYITNDFPVNYNKNLHLTEIKKAIVNTKSIRSSSPTPNDLLHLSSIWTQFKFLFFALKGFSKLLYMRLPVSS